MGCWGNFPQSGKVMLMLNSEKLAIHSLPEASTGALNSAAGSLASPLQRNSSAFRILQQQFAQNTSLAKLLTFNFLFITLLTASAPEICAQVLPPLVPSAAQIISSATPAPADSALPDSPEATLPELTPVAATENNTDVSVQADTQRKVGDIYYLDGNAVIYYRDYVLRADHIVYNDDTNEATAEGHLHLTGGRDHEDFTATHGTADIEQESGTFYDVLGSIGLVRPQHAPASTADNPFLINFVSDNLSELQPDSIFPASSNPFIITGRVVHKLAPYTYKIEGGSMTSCTLPHPDWQFTASQMAVDASKGSASNSIFHLLGAPLVYMPYVSHPVDSDSRQTGVLMPVISTSTTNGITLGEEFYWKINRSADLLVGLDYLSRRGWSPKFSLRFRGPGRDFLNFHYTGLFDRGYYPIVNNVPTYTNQGGEDATLTGRYAFNDHTYASGNIEYLSSYVYREAFSQNFLQATSSEVHSTLFVTREQNGTASSLLFDRFQSFENAAVSTDIIRILHLPSLDFSSVERPIGHSPFNWAVDAASTELQRHEPGFDTNGLMYRLDLHPRIYANVHWDGFTLQPRIGLRETFYSRSQLPPASVPKSLPTQQNTSINRLIVEGGFELRPPVVERTFLPGHADPDGASPHGTELKHTIEPFLKYNYVEGVDNFNNILRFDPVDIISDTSEMHYGLTQRLLMHQLAPHKCKVDETPRPGETLCRSSAQEWLSLTISQKYFFVTDFGGAIINHRRNVLDTSLDFTGIAFLTGPRNLSPVQSQLRLRTTSNTDLEWDLNYDTVNGRIATSNVFGDYRKGSWFAGVGDAHMDAPDEVLIQGQITHIADFNQIRMMLGYGGPQAHGLSAAANYGYDINQNVIEYSAIQTSYNSNCCGFSFEYRHYSLGSIRDENVYRFSITLNGIGTTGNLRRADRIY